MITGSHIRPLLLNFQVLNVKEYQKWKLDKEREIKGATLEIDYKLNYPADVYTQKDIIAVYKRDYINVEVESKDNILESVNQNSIKPSIIQIPKITINQNSFVVKDYINENLFGYYINVKNGSNGTNNLNKNISSQIQKSTSQVYKIEVKQKPEPYFIYNQNSDLNNVLYIGFENNKLKPNYNIDKEYKILVRPHIRRIYYIDIYRYSLLEISPKPDDSKCPTCIFLTEYGFLVNKEYNTSEQYISPQSLQDTWGSPEIKLDIPLGVEIEIFRIVSDSIKIEEILERPKHIRISDDLKVIYGKLVIPNKVEIVKVKLNNGQVFTIYLNPVITSVIY